MNVWQSPKYVFVYFKRTNLKTGVSRKQSTPNFPKNEHFLPPDTHTYVCVSGGKKCSFFGKFGVLCFLETLALRFALLPYYQRYYVLKYSKMPEYAEQKIFIFKKITCFSMKFVLWKAGESLLDMETQKDFLKKVIKILKKTI